MRWYGLIYVLGFLLTYLFLRHARMRGALKKISEDDLDWFMFWLLIGVVVGARVFAIFFYYGSSFLADPLVLFRIWQGGLSFHGGLVGAFIASFFFAQKHKLDFFSLADLMVIPASLALALGRIANFINGELFGTITSSSVGVNFGGEKSLDGSLVFRHPYQLYASAKNFVLFFLLLVWDRSTTFKRRFPSGILTFFFLASYSFFRFILDFLREEPDVFVGLSMGQLLSLAMFLASFVWLGYILKRRKK
ncbi:MAG: prolipoprotein diacylglyceryl transferase [Candidatus Woesearchaeota archaeon]|nr:MAG: prolipoprotein diacylglyceryl transferase [Candidatus Woesearchaeota archaeon]